MIYPDLSALLSLLVAGDHTREANRLLRGPGHTPLSLSIIHRLQVENALLRYYHSSDRQMQTIARDALLLWRHYLEEEVFQLGSFDLSGAFARAAARNAEWSGQPPRWHQLIHVALAATESASFLSFDPTLRRVASKAGLPLIPAKL